VAILFDSTRPRQISRTFARGLLRSTPSTQRVSYSDADLAEYMAYHAARDEENRRLEQQAGVYECRSRMDAGYPIM
jgi:hypothetical protein